MSDSKFKNPEVDAKYKRVFSTDKRITIHGVYSGMLSNITPAAAEALIKAKDNQIELKPNVAAEVVSKAEKKPALPNTEK